MHGTLKHICLSIFFLILDRILPQIRFKIEKYPYFTLFNVKGLLLHICLSGLLKYKLVPRLTITYLGTYMFWYTLKPFQINLKIP